MKAFKEKDNTAVITCIHIVHEKKPILIVSHDEDDGGWQFLCGKLDHNENEALIISLKEIMEFDPNLNEISDLPIGFTAFRDSINEKWDISKG